MKGKKDKLEGGKSRISNSRPQIIILGVLTATVGGMYWLYRPFWDVYWLPVLLIAIGIATPLLFDRWKFWAGYGWQVGIAPGLAFILMGIFILLFGYDIDNPWSNAVSILFLTNVVVLSLWFVFIIFLFHRTQNSGQEMRDYYRGERWRDYRWVIAPTIIILLFLFDTSWAQSTLSIPSLKKSTIQTIHPDTFQIHAEYPSQILFNEISLPEINLWVTDSINCVDLEISADGLLFAIKSPSDTPLKWDEKLTLKFDETTTAITLLVRPSQLPETDSKSIQLNLIFSGNNLAKGWQIIVESKRDFQTRDWKKNFLSTGSTVVSLIVAVFAGIKQLEEEKKRRKAEQIKQVIAALKTDAKNNLSKTLHEYLALTAEWGEWDRMLQEQFRKAYDSFIKENLWDALAHKTMPEIANTVDLCLQMYNRISENKKPILLDHLHQALQMGDSSPWALLDTLKKHPASIVTAKRIAVTLPSELKKQAIIKYFDEFSDEIRALKDELGVIDIESFPLQEIFAFYAKPHHLKDKLTAWLQFHELECSPFADTDSPFYSVLDGQFLIDWASPAFALPTPNSGQIILEFKNYWDAGAAMYEYCKAFQSNIKVKDDVFFVVITPSIVKDYESDHPRKLYLHALAEQWTWSLAETPTLFYALKGEERELVGRLIRWHNFSSSVTAYKIEQIAGSLQKGENKNLVALLSKITEWLNDKNATYLRTEEVNMLIDLRPSPKNKTLFLISASNLDPRMKSRAPSGLYEKLTEQSDWLNTHNCAFLRFAVGTKDWQTISLPSLINQCNIRVRKCSKNKIEFNQLFDVPGQAPDVILAQKANGSPGKMVRLGQKLLLQHVERYSSSQPLHIEDLEVLEI